MLRGLRCEARAGGLLCCRPLSCRLLAETSVHAAMRTSPPTHRFCLPPPVCAPAAEEEEEEEEVEGAGAAGEPAAAGEQQADEPGPSKPSASKKRKQGGEEGAEGWGKIEEGLSGEWRDQVGIGMPKGCWLCSCTCLAGDT